jgi:hypothetical protein
MVPRRVPRVLVSEPHAGLELETALETGRYFLDAVLATWYDVVYILLDLKEATLAFLARSFGVEEGAGRRVSWFPGK